MKPLLLGVWIAALSGCAAHPDSDGWYSVGPGRIALSAGDLGDGCRLIGGDYPEYQLDPRGVVRPDPTVTQCDALVELEGIDLVLSGSDGVLHPAYESVGLQPLLVTPTSLYMSLKDITSPGSFRLPIVYQDGGDEREAHLRVEALAPE